MMKNKKEMSRILNSSLGLEVHWEKLSQEDLNAICKRLGNTQELLKELLTKEAKGRVRKHIDKLAGLIDGEIINELLAPTDSKE